MANTINTSINVDAGNSSKVIGDLRQEYRDLLKEIQNTQKGTQDYYTVLAKLGDVKGNIKDLREEIVALDPEEKFASIGKAVTGLAGGFEAATGAAALFAGKNKELEETLLKVNAAIAVTHGLQELQGGLKAANVLLESFQAKLRNAAITSTEATVAIEGQTVATEEAAVATTELNTALLANPVILVTAAVVALAAAILYFTSKSKEAEEQTQRLNLVLKEQKEVLDLDLAGVQRRSDLAIAALKARTDSEIAASDQTLTNLQQKKLVIDNAVKETADNLEKARQLEKDEDGKAYKDADQANVDAIKQQKDVNNQILIEGQNKLKIIRDNNKQQVDLQQDLDAKLKATRNQTGAGNNSALSTYDTAAATAEKARQDDLKKVKDYYDKGILSLTQYHKDVNEINQIFNTTQLRNKQKYIDDEGKLIIEEEYQKQNIALQEQLTQGLITRDQYDQLIIKNKIEFDERLLSSDHTTAQDRLKIQKDLGDQQLALLKVQYDQQVKLIQTQEKKETDASKTKYKNLDSAATLFTKQTGLNVNYQTVITANGTKEQEQIKIDSLNKQLSAAKATGQNTTEIESQLSESQKSLSSATKDAKIADITAVSDTLTAAGQALGEQTAAGKALAIAGATIATYQAAVSSFNSLAVIPIVGPALGAVAAGVAIASGIANIAKIVAVQVPGTSSSGSAGSISAPSIGGGALPTYNAPKIASSANVTNISGSSLDALGQTLNQNQNPVRAYVVESDITNSQQQVAGYQNSSRI